MVKYSEQKESNTEIIKNLIVQCWKDPNFEERFIENPAAVLQELNISMASNMHVHVYKNSEHDVYIVIPQKTHSILREDFGLKMIQKDVHGG